MQLEKSAVTEHYKETWYKIVFGETTLFVMSAEYMGILVKEAIETHLHLKNFNRDNGLLLSKAWYPSINMLLKVKQPTSHHSPDEGG